MNNAYFSFTREPFSRELAPSEVFISKGHRELLARLRHAIETGSLAVITGHVGSGKSTTIRSVMHSLEASRYRYLYLASSGLTPAEFYKGLLYQVDVQPGRAFSHNKRLVAHAMMDLYQKGIKPIVVVDEAQELTVPMLSELRFVLNYRTDSFSPLMIILAGQPQLAETLRLQVLECIRQRISVRYRLPCLEEEEIPAYILHHLKIAGVDKQIFADEAIALIYQFSKGIPRRINNLCRYALLAAVAADNSIVDATAVKKGLEEEDLI
ncbi:P-loop containing nucleoside triphosphate hydrolase [Acididesulfobacillus acetoxydans]|uniref:AAA ATPase n=1 Tax=Acididesulfobacillus acetoxydans TaxID=1561005 RepID=A0A8S0X4L1_9FIRM|nr:AAA family ATPase [Acididesulfobacillus acetoxydans]CAA7600870.1 P-loop containing nucleoside triphosphate hydrolase [Acididesulfobacillus acetoxydans]CEJ07219.1 AAA ATPase [Acididesulfobacillus acetoxydans]